MQKEVKPSNRIDSENGVFVKWGPKVGDEYNNTKAAFELSLKSDTLFKVPKPINFDEANSTATFQYISGLVELNNLDNDSPHKKHLIVNAGRSLAHVHTNIKVDKSKGSSFKYNFEVDDKYIGFIHGDFNLQNVQCRDDQLIILDWQLSPLFDTEATYGCYFQDIYWFVRSIMQSSPNRFRNDETTINFAKLFLKNYREVNNIPMDELKDFSVQFEKSLGKLTPIKFRSKLNYSLLKRKLDYFWLLDI